MTSCKHCGAPLTLAEEADVACLNIRACCERYTEKRLAGASRTNGPWTCVHCHACVRGTADVGVWCSTCAVGFTHKWTSAEPALLIHEPLRKVAEIANEAAEEALFDDLNSEYQVSRETLDRLLSALYEAGIRTNPAPAPQHGEESKP